MKSWNKIIVGTIVSGLVITNTAYAQLQPPIQLAQESLLGQCRQIKQTSPIYEMRGGAEVIGTLSKGTRVLLDEPGPIAGRIYVILPNVINGFIDPNNLAPCDAELPSNAPVSAQPTFSGNPICVNNRVDKNKGLPILSLPSPDVMPPVDWVYPAERISIIGESFFNSVTQTEWLQIDHPATGWIENGQPNTVFVNTSPCNAL